MLDAVVGSGAETRTSAAPKGDAQPAKPTATRPAIPVARPLLPGSGSIAPYVDEIHRNRYYSNFGPLVRRLEQRLAEMLAPRIGRDCGVLTVANGTLGLVAALQAQDPPKGRYCLVPAWTFAASPHAVLMAGLTPYFVDVDPTLGALTPEIARTVCRRLGPEVAAVMPVAPHGAWVDTAAWDGFMQETGCAVVIDAAAGFDTVTPGMTPTVVSLHATKVLPAGEGGFVATTDKRILRRVQQISNFGFDGTRTPLAAATNAKMSEYAAAVALAAIDNWPEIRAAFLQVADRYQRAFAGDERIQVPPGLGNHWATSTMTVRVPADALDDVVAALDAAGIDHRFWWGDGCHTTPAFARYPRDPLPVTKKLADRTIGLPCFPDMSAEDIKQVAATVTRALGPTAAPARFAGVPAAT